MNNTQGSLETLRTGIAIATEKATELTKVMSSLKADIILLQEEIKRAYEISGFKTEED